MTRLLRRQTVAGPVAWMGSLMQDAQDASGLMFRRNRFYDPAVRASTETIALAASPEDDGDIEVFIDPQAASTLRDALDRAIALAGGTLPQGCEPRGSADELTNRPPSHPSPVAMPPPAVYLPRGKST